MYVPLETLTGSKSTYPTILYFSFQFDNKTQLLSACLKSELHLLLPVSEMEKFHTLAFNFGG